MTFSRQLFIHFRDPTSPSAMYQGAYKHPKTQPHCEMTKAKSCLCRSSAQASSLSPWERQDRDPSGKPWFPQRCHRSFLLEKKSVSKYLKITPLMCPLTTCLPQREFLTPNSAPLTPTLSDQARTDCSQHSNRLI